MFGAKEVKVWLLPDVVERLDLLCETAQKGRSEMVGTLIASAPIGENAFAESLAGMADYLEPAFEQARGVKARLLEEGWMEVTAEQAALTWLQGCLALAFTGGVAQAAKQ